MITFWVIYVISSVCCLLPGDAGCSWITRRQGQSDLGSCDFPLLWTSDYNVFLFQGQEGPSPVIPGPQGQKVSRFAATVDRIQIGHRFFCCFVGFVKPPFMLQENSMSWVNAGCFSTVKVLSWQRSCNRHNQLPGYINVPVAFCHWTSSQQWLISEGPKFLPSFFRSNQMCSYTTLNEAGLKQLGLDEDLYACT